MNKIKFILFNHILHSNPRLRTPAFYLRPRMLGNNEKGQHWKRGAIYKNIPFSPEGN